MRLLFLGDLEDDLNSVFKYVDSLNSVTTPIEWILFIGRFPSETEDDLKSYIRGGSRANTPTFYFRPIEVSSSPATKSVANLVGLGNLGVIVTPDNLRIVYCIELELDSDLEKQMGIIDILKCQIGAGNPVDVLITNTIPYGFRKNLKTEPDYLGEESQLAARLAYEFKPRYHLCTALSDYERRPYRNHITLRQRASTCTRLVLLSGTDIASKKGMYALDLKPLKMNAHPFSAEVTDSPYLDQIGNFNTFPSNLEMRGAEKEDGEWSQ